MHMEAHYYNWDTKKWPRQAGFMLFRQRNLNLWEIDRTKKTYVGELQIVKNSKQNLGLNDKLVKIIGVCLYSFLGSEFSTSGDKDVSLVPGTGRVPFSREIYFLISGNTEGVRMFLHCLLPK